MLLEPGRLRTAAALRFGIAIALAGVSLSAMGRPQDPLQQQQQQQDPQQPKEPRLPPDTPPPDPSLALITGRVVDDKGAPVANTGVRALRVRAIAGRTLLDTDVNQSSTGATTDADGVYKMSVPAGRYAVALPATPAHATLFFPASANASGAVLLSLTTGGAQAGIDFTVAPSHTVKVSGTLSGSEAISNLTVRLEREEFGEQTSELDVLSATTTATGQFTFPFVHPGRYRVRVRKSLAGQQTRVQVDPAGVHLMQQPPRVAVVPSADDVQAPAVIDTALWADTSLDVSEESTGIDNVDIWLQPGPRVSGRVVFQGTAIRPAGVSLKSTSVVLVPIDDRDQSAAVARIEEDDEVHLPAVLPGRYAVTLVPALATTGGGWSLSSIALGGRDITGLVTEITSDLSDLTVTLTNAPASTITGTVRFPHGTNTAGITVYVFPGDRAVWTSAFDPGHLVWFRSSKPDPLGSFAMFVRPGTYLVAAVSGAADQTWTDPDSLADLAAAATLVRVDGNPGRPLDLVLRAR